MIINRIYEYVDNNKTGLQSATVKQHDLETGGMWAGVPCDTGSTRNSQHPGENCVIQDFFLDTFAAAQLTVAGSEATFSFPSNVQGTAPWCGKTDPSCANQPALVPTVTVSVSAEAGLFTDNKLMVTIENFPYKLPNSSLAIGASIFAESISASMRQDAATGALTVADGIDCTAAPLSSMCPRIDLNDRAQFSWARTATSATNNKTKVITSTPQRVKSGVTGSNGMRLLQNTMFFSFEHAQTSKIQWEARMTVQPDPLPRDLKSAAPQRWSQSSWATAILVGAALMYSTLQTH